MRILINFLAAAYIIVFAHEGNAQEFKPHPTAGITQAQWQKYYSEVKEKHGATAQDFIEQKLLVFTDKATGTSYAFTQPGHAAHPAWVARKPEQRGDGIFIAQIGYFAGSEAPFAILFKQYAALNEKMSEDIKSKQAKLNSAAAEPKTQSMQLTSSANKDPNWRPTDAQVELVKNTTQEFFASRDSNQTERAYRYLSERLKVMLPFGSYKQSIEAFNNQAGDPLGRQVHAITWYKDSPNGLGLYAAVDFTGNFSKLALHCGYVVWHEQLDGTFLQVREENNIIDKTTMEKLKDRKSVV